MDLFGGEYCLICPEKTDWAVWAWKPLHEVLTVSSYQIYILLVRDVLKGDILLSAIDKTHRQSNDT